MRQHASAAILFLLIFRPTSTLAAPGVTRGLGGRKRVFVGYSAWRTSLLILLCVGTGVSPTLHANGGRETRHFEPSACPQGLPAGIRVDCGFLVVPENRRDNDEGRFWSPGKTIRIAVAVSRASSGVALPDPIVFVQGGPSAAAIDPGTIVVLSSLFGAHRDVIFVDTRGTGRSQPRLGCPEFDALAVAAFPNAPPRATYLASVRQCRDRLRANGVDLDAYDSASTAEDLDDIRVALGYDRWNVLAVSNGGLATLTLMRLHPEGIRSVVLDSPTSNDNLWIVDRWRTANRLLEKVFADCAADSACDGQFPGLRAVFYGLIDALRQNPVDVSVPNPAGGPDLTAHVTGDVFLAGVARVIQNPTVLPSLPATIFFAAHGGLAQVVRAAVGAPTPLSDVFAYGKTLSTLCSDIIPFETRYDRTDAARAIPEFRNLLLDPDALAPFNRQACEVWGVPRASEVQHHPVRRRIPTLILSGEYDGVVSPDEGERIAAALRRALFYQVPGVGHIVITGTCASAMASQFFNDPESVPNTSCLRATARSTSLP
jgi:pimeloyl-ACP methyl ester carboxylesterase